MESIQTSISEARSLIEAIKGPQDQINITSAQSAIEALGEQFQRSDDLSHYGDIISLQQALEAKITPSRASVHAVQESPRIPGRRILGTINQYEDGRHPRGTFSHRYRVSCPSTTLAFVSHFLNHGASDLDGQMVDRIIQTGQNNFLPLIQTREASLEGLLSSMVPEKKATGGKLKALLEQQLIPLANKDPNKQARLEIKLYGRSYTINVQVKGGLVSLQLLYGRDILSTWQGTDFDEVSTLLAKDMLLKARELKRNESGLLRGNMMTPIDALPEYERFIGERPKTPDAFFLAKNPLPTQSLEETRRAQIEEMIQRELLPITDQNPHGRVASTITINGQILGIGVEKRGRDVTITLFDSHGKGRLHQGREEGYVYVTASAAEASTTLLKMMKIESEEVEVKGLSKADYAMISASQERLNEVSLWLAKPRPELVPYRIT